MKKIGIPKALLYYYYNDLWIYFFKYLRLDVIYSNSSNKKILSDGESLAPDEACLSLKLYLGHVKDLINKCDYILVPRLYSIKKNEGVCTNFNALYDLVNNTFDNINTINYNVDLTKKENELLGFLNLGKDLGFSYINSYTAYKFAKEKSLENRLQKEEKQKKALLNDNIKILIAAHPYNLYDDLVGKPIIDYLEDNNITVIYSDRINHKIIDSECKKISKDIHWTHSKEVMASINYYKDKVNGIIIISAFPCGPDSLANELAIRKIKSIPILKLIMEDLNSDIGILTRLESFIDILKQKKEETYERNN